MESYDKAVENYIKATELEPVNVNAWKGLLDVAERTNNGALQIKATIGIIKSYEADNDLTRAMESLRHLKKYSSKHPWKRSNVEVLELQLPGSPIFSFLEGRLDPPEKTAIELAKILEKEEQVALSKNSHKNTLAISSDLKKRKETTNLIYKNSPLPELYNKIMNWTRDDSVRRDFEERLLKHKYSHLEVAPASEKKALIDEIRNMAEDLVVINSNTEFAWRILIEWQDPVELKDYDPKILLSFVEKFPKSPLSKSIIGFFRSDISPFDSTIFQEFMKSNIKKSKSLEETPTEEPESKELKSLENNDLNNEQSNEDNSVLLAPEIVLEYLTDGISPDSILSHRILASYYCHIREYESTTDYTNKGIRLINSSRKTLGLSFPNSLNDLETLEGLAFIYYQSPKNHAAAMNKFGTVLKSNPHYTPALVGKGILYREMQKFKKSAEILQAVLKEDENNMMVLFEYSWCLVLLGSPKQGRVGLMKFLKSLTGNNVLTQDYKAQAWWRIGESYWLAKANVEKKKDPEALEELFNSCFDAFTNSLKANPNYASSYTSLGKLYLANGDKTKASKCFLKAFELDGSEIEAAKELAIEFSTSNHWELVEVVASRVLESERVRYIGSDKALVWPYRVLGLTELNNHNFAVAVTRFQSALRIDSKDISSWIGLGEAYTHSGRYGAAEKTFAKASSLDPKNWVPIYYRGIVLRSIKEFSEACRVFRQVVSLSPNEFRPKVALIETILLAAKHELSKEIYTEASLLASECISTAVDSIKQGVPLTQDLWRVLGECCEIFLSVRSFIENAPMENLLELAKHADSLVSNEDISIISEIDNITPETLNERKNSSNFLVVVICYILFFKLSLYHCRQDKSSLASAWLNLGLTELKIYLLAQSSFDSDTLNQYLFASIEAFKKSTSFVNTHADTWNAYGLASSFVNPKVAHHCFVRSLVLDSRQPTAWTNLAVLYLKSGDLELADEAVEKALSGDPEFVSAWIGRGIINYNKGNQKAYHENFSHAYQISKGSDKLAKIFFALSAFESLGKKDENYSSAKQEFQLETSVISLQKYLAMVPDSTVAMNLEALILERVSDFDSAIEYGTKLCETFEQRYENFENNDDLIDFVKAKAQLARTCLAAERYEEAIEHGNFAIQVSSQITEEDEGVNNQLATSRLSVHLTTGLGYYFTQQFDEAIECFKNALVESDEDQDVVVLLAQVLWANGGDDEKNVALQQLFNVIEGDAPVSLNVLLSFGAIGMTHDSELIVPAEEELSKLSQEFLQKHDNSQSVPLMLAALNKAQGKNPKLPWLKAAYFNPWNFEIWRRIDNKVALNHALMGNVSTLDLSNLYATQDDFRSLQKGVFYAPWNPKSWETFSSAL